MWPRILRANLALGEAAKRALHGKRNGRQQRAKRAGVCQVRSRWQGTGSGRNASNANIP